MLNNLPDGTYLYTWTTTNAYCSSRADTVSVTIYSPPSLAVAGDNQIIHTTFATLNAVPCDTGTGTWSFVTGSGQFENVNDPATRVTGLANGINILRWTTSNGVCIQTSDTMQIEVRTLIIPTGYSPNGDGTNDNFVIEGLSEYSNVKLEVFNRWGNQVYISGDYKNDWNGVGMGGEILPDDIYYFVMKLEDGTVFTGYVSLKQRTL
jgi:gliding motility-associated-like protein